MKKIFYTAAFSMFAVSHMHALLVTGDSNATTGETFSFNVGFAVFDTGSELSSPRLWTATGETIASDTARPYGLSFINQLISYVPSGVLPVATAMTNEENATIYTFDGTTAAATSAANPIWGAAFSFFNVSAQKPSFVLTSDLTKVYLVQDIQRYTTQTATEKNKTELIRYDVAGADQTRALLQIGDTLFLAHSVGAFGATTSKITEVQKASFVVSEIKDQAGKVLSQITLPYLKTIADTAIAVSTAALLGGTTNNLAALGTNVTFNNSFNSLYIGLQTTAANVVDADRAVALTYATITADSGAASGFSFVFNNIVPTAVIQASNFNTVVSTNRNNQVRITKVASMATSTGLQYLIVARDAGTGPQTVYAVPVVSSGINMGQIADFTSIKNYFGTKPALFGSRQFDTVISDGAQINLAGAYSTQITVGTPPTTGDLKQLYVVGDSVYAVIGDSYASGVTPGTFRSQPIFAQAGHIVAWTPWQRVLGSDQTQQYSFIDAKTISGYTVGHKTTGTFRSIYQTTFVPDSNFAPLLSLSATGGTQGLFNFAQSTPGFNSVLSLMISTGFGTTSIGQTGKVLGGFFKINDPMATTDVKTFTGAALNDHHALVACEIAHDTSTPANHWIFVGGVKGVSVLSNDTTGVTWSSNLADLSTDPFTGQTFKKVGDFTFVKKLVWDRTAAYLYVLTSNELYRIALNPNKFKAAPTATLNAELLLQGSQLSQTPAYFLDLLVDSGFCVIGTTNGMYTLDVSGGGQALQQITIPDGLSAVSQITAVSANNEPNRNFKTLSNLIVLNNSFGTQQARINRFTVTNGIVAPFNDFLIATQQDATIGSPTSFVKFNNYINNYFTDGTLYLACSYYLGLHQPSGLQATPYVLQLFAGIRAGLSSSQLIMTSLSAYAPLTFVSTAPNIAGFVRESTSGSLISFGGFPTQAHV